MHAGYEAKDWYVPPPSHRAPTTDLLTPEQTRETLNYFRKLFFAVVVHVLTGVPDLFIITTLFFFPEV